jgi:hypothetical protein
MKCTIKETTKKYEKWVDNKFSKVAENISDFDKHDIISSSKEKKELSHLMNEYQVAISEIYESGEEIYRYIDESLIQEEQTELVQALNGDLDPVNLSKDAKPLYEKIRKNIDANADALVKAGVLKEKNKIKDYLKRVYEKHEKDKSFIGKLFYTKKFKKRKDLTHEERIALGMSEDASKVIPKTLADQRIQLLKANMLKDIADRFGKDEEFENSIRVSDETVGGGVNKYGALAGKYVPKKIHDALLHAELLKENMGILERYIYPVVDHIKVNVTVKNPVTHLYNIGSNIMLSGINGDIVHVGKVMTWAKRDPKKFAALLKKANKYGLNSSLRDFEGLKNDIGEDTHNSIVGKIFGNLYLSEKSYAGKKARKIYDWEDKIFKLGAFQRLLEEGVPEKEAFYSASEVYVDYSTPLPASVRVLDKSGLFPFTHYLYKATPATMKVIAKNPMKFIMLQVAMLGAGASAWFNEDDDLLKPEWAKNQMNLFGAKEWVSLGNNSWFLNAGRMIPGLKFGGIDVSMDTGFGFVGGFVNMMNGKTPLGYNISSKYDESYVKAGKKILTMAENYLPPVTFGRYGQRSAHIGLAKAGLVEPKKNYYKEDMTMGELGSRALGVRKFNRKSELESKKRANNNWKKEMIKRGKDKKAVNDQYNKTALQIKNAGKKIKYDLSDDAEVSFFKDAKFSF